MKKHFFKLRLYNREKRKEASRLRRKSHMKKLLISIVSILLLFSISVVSFADSIMPPPNFYENTSSSQTEIEEDSAAQNTTQKVASTRAIIKDLCFAVIIPMATAFITFTLLNLREKKQTKSQIKKD